MDSVALLSLAITVGEKFLQLMLMVRKKARMRPKRSPDSLQIELSWLCDCLLILKSSVTLGLGSQAPQALETLLEDLLSSVQHVDNLLKPPQNALASREVELYGELFMSKFRSQVESALLEMQRKHDLQAKVVRTNKARTEQKVEEKEMITVINFVLQREACHNPMLKEVLSFVQNMAYPTETYQMLFEKLLVFERRAVIQAPELEKKGDCEVVEVDTAGMLMKEKTEVTALEESETKQRALDKEEQVERSTELVKEVVLNNPPDKEEQVERSTELVNEVVLNNPPDKEEQVERSTELVNEVVLNNPNYMLRVVAEKGEGVVDVSVYKGNQWRVKYQGSSLDVRMVRGERQMEVSRELGYLYYEVKLVEMVELVYESKPG